MVQQSQVAEWLTPALILMFASSHSKPKVFFNYLVSLEEEKVVWTSANKPKCLDFQADLISSSFMDFKRKTWTKYDRTLEI